MTSTDQPTPDDLLKVVAETQVIKKVPGKVAPVGRLTYEAKAYADQIRQMGLPALRDLLAREEKILSNRRLCQSLPDKGQKVKMKKEEIEKLIAEKNRLTDEAAALFSGLSIGGEKVKSLEEMEFKFGGGLPMLKGQKESRPLDSDDDTDDEESKDPLTVLAEREVPAISEAQRSVPEESPSNEELDLHAKKLAHRVNHTESKDRFMPFLSSSSGSKDGSGSKTTPKSKAPKELMPLPDGSDAKAKLITLEESICIQREQSLRLKEAQLKQAADRLAASSSSNPSHDASSPGAVDITQKMAYRDLKDTDEQDGTDTDASEDS